MKASPEETTGQTRNHLKQLGNSPYYFHKNVLSNFLKLQAEAKIAGFDLVVCSAFRSFEDQLRIWNEKATGKRPLYDSDGSLLEFKTLSEKEILFSILRWSALPGASRHHWGTDFDIYDKAAVPKGYHIQLIPQEVEGEGYFVPMHDWLDGQLETFGFFRPYEKDRGGVAPERWHLSHKDTATQYQKALTPSLLTRTIKNSEIALKALVLDSLDEIFEKYILNTN